MGKLGWFILDITLNISTTWRWSREDSQRRGPDRIQQILRERLIQCSGHTFSLLVWGGLGKMKLYVLRKWKLYWRNIPDGRRGYSSMAERYRTRGWRVARSIPGRSIIIIITTRHACWRIGRQRSSSTPVCHWPASGWCPSCSSCSSFPLPQFFARLSSVDHASAFPPGSVDFNFGDGVGILMQHVPNPAPSLPGDVGLPVRATGDFSRTRQLTLEKKNLPQLPIGASGDFSYPALTFCADCQYQYPFHPHVSAVARKRPVPFFQRRSRQVTAKHAYTLDSTKSEWADCAVQA